MATPLYIFDLDGTLALIDHRRHLVERPKCPACNGQPVDLVTMDTCAACHGAGFDQAFRPDWRAFYAACVDDAPNWPVIQTMQRLADTFCNVWIWSGRSDEVREPTIDWLCGYIWPNRSAMASLLRMRAADDFTPDVTLKKQWLDAMTPDDRKRLAAVFDDRAGVVKMWRANGVPCFQVAEGDF